MIVSAILYDLVGAKVWSTMSFYKNGTVDISCEKIVEEYYTIKRNTGIYESVDLRLENRLIKLREIDDSTLLLCINDETRFSESGILKFDGLAEELMGLARITAIRDVSKLFTQLAKEHLCEKISICLVYDDVGSSNTPTEKAIQQLISSKEYDSESFTKPVMIGPFGVSITHLTMETIIGGFWNMALTAVHAMAFVLPATVPEEEKIMSLVHIIRKNTPSTLLIIPGSDKNLERARELELVFDMILCDVVSPRPSYLLLEILAMTGLIDMHPELASEKLDIDKSIDEQDETDDTEGSHLTEAIGHQAFFVVDKMTGQSIFNYYYEAKDDFLRRAPNVIAAITMFSLDSSIDSSTSVFRTGNMTYAMIEHKNLIFTLITGKSEDEDAIRERFSFLPDLWSAEEIKELDDSDSPYHAVPFTLKLLATLPSEELTSKHLPVQIDEPTWTDFKSPEVRDFLKAVWSSLTSSLPMSKLVQTRGPQMTLGAIHFLRKMGSIDLRVSITETDIPIFIGTLDEDLRNLYSHIDMISELIDGKRSIYDISKEIKIQVSVLIAVFSELHKRRIVGFAE